MCKRIRSMVFSSLHRLWWTADRKLSKYQEGLLAAVMIIAAGVASLILIRLLVLSWEALSAEDLDASAISWEGARNRAQEFPDTIHKRTDADATGALGPASLPALRVDWHHVKTRRRAASLLSLEGNLQEALELLGASDPARERLLEVADRDHQSVLTALEETLAFEEQRLAQLGHALPGPDPSPRDPSRRQPADRLRHWRSVLPEDVLFRFAVNLHCRLRDRTRASDVHLKLILESCFPPGSVARTLYVDSTSLEPGGDRSLPAAGASGVKR